MPDHKSVDLFGEKLARWIPAKPFVKWAGGKGNLLNILESQLPADFDSQAKVTYIEPFVGGANIIDKIHCPIKIGFDKNAPLIALHHKAQKDFNGIPLHGSDDLWYRAKNAYRAA